MRDVAPSGPSFEHDRRGRPRTARCHTPSRATCAIAPGQLVVIDWGAMLDGYCSDCTRTVAAGELDDEAKDVYELVLRRPSWPALRRSSAGADGARRRRLRASGDRGRRPRRASSATASATASGSRFTRPRGSRSAPRTTLQAGNVVTVEPGVYLPGQFGVRIEDLVAVTDEGCEILTSIPKDLRTVG